MALEVRITQDELMLYELLRNPVLCTEFIYNVDKLEYEEPFEYAYYQVDFICDFNPYVSICCARSVGKTESLSGLIIWLLINNVFPLDYIVYSVPNRSHLEPVWSKLTRYFRTSSFLKYFLDYRSGINNAEFSLKLNNSTQLLCRIAGMTGTGTNVFGLHTPYVIIDEGGIYPYGTWLEAQPILNTFTQGFHIIVSGVPTGIRERNVLYHVDQENSSYTKHRIKALQNPRFTEEDRDKAIELYGGVETDDYIHIVLGEHGKPIFSLFDRNAFEISNYPIYKLTLDGSKMFDNLSDYFNKLSIFPGLPNRDDRCIFGIDLGYTEPTAIVIMIMDNFGRFRFHGRIRLDKVNYFIQEKLIDYLDSRFGPMVIGIDEGAAGKAVIPRLQEHDDYLHKGYNKRVIPVNFSTSIVIGTDASGEEIKSKTKPFAVGILQDYSNNHKIIYSSTDLEMITELERMTYSTNAISGDISYKTLTERGGKKGEDHFTQALLCAVMSFYIAQETLALKKHTVKLMQPRWNF